ncbi:MAG TPA: hypothetical protein VM822_01750, partial [Pseudolabrys sp.]|nr:hypothetical protein [Pseudolabrys sp.]
MTSPPTASIVPATSWPRMMGSHGVLRFDRWKIVHDQLQMFAHRALGLVGLGLFDRIDDGGMLAHELALRKASQGHV